MEKEIMIGGMKWKAEPDGISLHDVATTLLLGHAVEVMLCPREDVSLCLVLAPISQPIEAIAITKIVDDDYKNFGGGAVVRSFDAFGEFEDPDEVLQFEYSRLAVPGQCREFLAKWFDLLWEELER